MFKNIVETQRNFYLSELLEHEHQAGVDETEKAIISNEALLAEALKRSQQVPGDFCARSGWS